MGAAPRAQLASQWEFPMTDLTRTDEIFFTRAGLDRGRLERQVAEALSGADDGELFLEYRQSESLAFDDGRLKNASFDTSQGFGLRAVLGESAGYAHATQLSPDAVTRAARTIQAGKSGAAGASGPRPARTRNQDSSYRGPPRR